MTRARAWVAVVAGLALVSAACVLKHSTHARLYVLRAVTPAAASAGSGPADSSASTGRRAAVLGVQRVSVPAWMDRPEIIARTGKGEILPDPLARWGEPVTRGIQRVVTENLAALLPDRHVTAAPYGVRQVVDHRLDVQVTECARQADGTVLLEARWAILDPDGAVLVQRRSSQRAGGGVRRGGDGGRGEPGAGRCSAARSRPPCARCRRRRPPERPDPRLGDEAGRRLLDAGARGIRTPPFAPVRASGLDYVMFAGPPILSSQIRGPLP